MKQYKILEKNFKASIKYLFKKRFEIEGYVFVKEYIHLKNTYYNIENEDFRIIFEADDINKKIVKLNEIVKNNDIEKNKIYELIFSFVFKNLTELIEKNIIKEEFEMNTTTAYEISNVLKYYFPYNLKQIKYKTKTSIMIYDSDTIKIKKITDINDFIDDCAEGYYYRGHSKVSYLLMPTIIRGNKNEYEVYNEAIKEYPDVFANKNRIEKLTIMQHNGIPTRLLDITKNPLVALYFACCENEKELGEVIVIDNNVEKKYNDSDTVSILSTLPSFNYVDKIMKVMKISKSEFKEDAYVKKFCYSVAEERRNFTNKYFEQKALLKCVIINANKNNQRIIRQNGAFILCGLNINDNIRKCLNNFRIRENNKKIVYIIGNKKSILEKLELLSINKHTMFPEISNYY